MILFVISIFILLSKMKSICCYRYEPNTLKLTNFVSCPEDEKNVLHANFSVNEITRNKYVLNGEIFYDEDVAGQIEVWLLNISLSLT